MNLLKYFKPEASPLGDRNAFAEIAERELGNLGQYLLDRDWVKIHNSLKDSVLKSHEIIKSLSPEMRENLKSLTAGIDAVLSREQADLNESLVSDVKEALDYIESGLNE